jgi:hypothetical protein
MEKELKEFCLKYEAHVDVSSRARRRLKKVDYTLWSESDPELFQPIPYEDVKCVEIHMPEDRLRALLEHDSWVERAGLHGNMHFANNVSRVSQIIVDHERECRIRHSNPAVQNAWIKYQTLLALVNSHYD